MVIEVIRAFYRGGQVAAVGELLEVGEAEAAALIAAGKATPGSARPQRPRTRKRARGVDSRQGNSV